MLKTKIDTCVLEDSMRKRVPVSVRNTCTSTREGSVRRHVTHIGIGTRVPVETGLLSRVKLIIVTMEGVSAIHISQEAINSFKKELQVPNRKKI